MTLNSLNYQWAQTTRERPLHDESTPYLWSPYNYERTQALPTAALGRKDDIASYWFICEQGDTTTPVHPVVRGTLGTTRAVFSFRRRRRIENQSTSESGFESGSASVSASESESGIVSVLVISVLQPRRTRSVIA